ncbi:sensor histidine kinase [Fimbriiglobus ruber]|uniref:histidine kinase n=1 Tax=Fimbriiglobus ruber TaxID=1908690 RepID=A0A225DY04_9BACT|nr:ATP-binding protein [Fimbriiglobus ruber]OWK44454.1 Osmosensitive K+ channel histidine kinase KdpD [Fimbriiglobus ruber]
MRIHRLRTRFVLAGCVVVAATVVSSLWSAVTFARLSSVVGETLQDNQEVIDLSAELAEALEREDDALLVALSGDRPRAERDLGAARRRGDDCYDRLASRLGEEGLAAVAAGLGERVAEYRLAGTTLVESADRVAAHEQYHRDVNPRLRRAVGACGQVREDHFRSMRSAGVRARDEAGRATRVVLGVAAAAVVLAAVVAAWLARSVVGPVRALGESLEAVRRGDYARRLPAPSADELGVLATGFNRMSEALVEYRSSSLGELVAAKTTLEATLNALPDAVIVIDPDGSIATTNPPARAVFAALGATGATRVRDLPLCDEHRGDIEAALVGKPSLPPRTEFGRALRVMADAGPRDYLLTAVPVPGFERNRTGAVVVLSDVTEFARLDHLRSELIGVASHELKTPLTALRMNLLLLGETAANLTDRQREMVVAAVGGCEELGGTIDEFLDVTRIEAGQLRLNLAVVDLHAVAGAAVRGLRPRFDDAGITLGFLPGDVPCLVRGDAVRLGVVFTNLLTNALKYSPAGGVVTVRVVSGQNAGGAGPPAPRIAVTDQGLGIPTEFRERVFEKFFRVETTADGDRNTVRGKGIGLYLCREIVRAHGGSIACESGDGGVGTRFAFTLPVT